MGAVLHRIEALPGEGRHAVTFRAPDGSEQTAVVHLTARGLDVAEASLPAGWSRDSEQFAATAAAVLAFDGAHRAGAVVAPLRDVPGGWDVSLGNIVLGENGVPACTAHGDLARTGENWTCAECGAQALFG
jgi:hypothetical protein